MENITKVYCINDKKSVVWDNSIGIVVLKMLTLIKISFFYSITVIESDIIAMKKYIYISF